MSQSLPAAFVEEYSKSEMVSNQVKLSDKQQDQVDVCKMVVDGAGDHCHKDLTATTGMEMEDGDDAACNAGTKKRKLDGDLEESPDEAKKAKTAVEAEVTREGENQPPSETNETHEQTNDASGQTNETVSVEVTADTETTETAAPETSDVKVAETGERLEVPAGDDVIMIPDEESFAVEEDVKDDLDAVTEAVEESKSVEPENEPVTDPTDVSEPIEPAVVEPSARAVREPVPGASSSEDPGKVASETPTCTDGDLTTAENAAESLIDDGGVAQTEAALLTERLPEGDSKICETSEMIENKANGVGDVEAGNIAESSIGDGIAVADKEETPAAEMCAETAKENRDDGDANVDAVAEATKLNGDANVDAVAEHAKLNVDANVDAVAEMAKLNGDANVDAVAEVDVPEDAKVNGSSENIASSPSIDGDGLPEIAVKKVDEIPQQCDIAAV